MKVLKEKITIFFKALSDTDAKHDLYNYIWKNYNKKISYYIKSFLNVDRHDINDVTQEVMIKVYKNLESYDFNYAFSTWIYRITRNHCIDLLRKKKVNLENLTDKHSTKKHTPENSLIDLELKNSINAALNSLDDTEREISFLHFYEGLKYKDISKIIDMPVGTIKYRMSQIKKQLKKKLEADYEN